MKSDTQVLYLGRWVSREHFCAFIYNNTGEKLVKSYDEFSELISSGIWFAERKNDACPKIIKECPDIDDKVVEIKTKRRRKCQSQQQQ